MNKNITIDSLDKPNPLPNGSKQSSIKQNPFTNPYVVSFGVLLVLILVFGIWRAYLQLDYTSQFGITGLERIISTLGKWTILLSPIAFLVISLVGIGKTLLNLGDKTRLTSYSEHQVSIDAINKLAPSILEKVYAVALEDAKQSKLRNVTNYSPTNSETNTSNGTETSGIDDVPDLAIVPWDKLIG